MPILKKIGGVWQEVVEPPVNWEGGMETPQSVYVKNNSFLRRVWPDIPSWGPVYLTEVTTTNTTFNMVWDQVPQHPTLGLPARVVIFRYTDPNAWTGKPPTYGDPNFDIHTLTWRTGATFYDDPAFGELDEWLPGVRYYLRVATWSGDGEEWPIAASNELTGVLLVDGPVLTLDNVGYRSVELSWTPVANVTAYVVELSTDGFSTIDQQITVQPNHTTHLINNLVNDTEYSIRVKGANPTGVVDFTTPSNVVSVTPAEPIIAAPIIGTAQTQNGSIDFGMESVEGTTHAVWQWGHDVNTLESEPENRQELTTPGETVTDTLSPANESGTVYVRAWLESVMYDGVIVAGAVATDNQFVNHLISSPTITLPGTYTLVGNEADIDYTIDTDVWSSSVMISVYVDGVYSHDVVGLQAGIRSGVLRVPVNVSISVEVTITSRTGLTASSQSNNSVYTGTAEAAPSGTLVTLRRFGLTIDWDATDHISDNPQYRFQVSTQDGIYFSSNIVSDSGPVNFSGGERLHVGLDTHTYHYVRASRSYQIGIVRVWSDWSNTVRGRTLDLIPPSSFDVTVLQGSAPSGELSWDTVNPLSYKIRRATDAGMTQNVEEYGPFSYSITSHQIFNHPTGTYYYQIQAIANEVYGSFYGEWGAQRTVTVN